VDASVCDGDICERLAWESVRMQQRHNNGKQATALSEDVCTDLDGIEVWSHGCWGLSCSLKTTVG